MACIALFWIAGAQAVHDDGLFELDGNAIDNPLLNGDDWQNICPATTPPGDASCTGANSAQASLFVTDGANASIFTGGGSKDDLDITQWRHTDGSVPDKDDLLHAFAARYDDHLYFGADRFAANGDAQMGIWFLQGEAAPLPDGTFSGTHTNGDILVLSDFTQGGRTPTIRVYEWQSPGGEINGTLNLIGSTDAADCLTIGDDDPFCALVNSTTVASPWAFTPKFDPPGSFPPGHFYEGGIDLAFLGLEDECFSSVIFETRASQSVDAVLKDFVAGGFEQCGATISITPSAVNAVGDTHTFTVTVTKNVGGSTTGAAGLNPTVTLTAAGGAAVTDKVDNCATTGTDSNGQCTVTFTSTTAGTITGHASATVVIGDDSIPVETNNQDGNSGDAVKRFVDASVTIGDSAVNQVNDSHTFTINVTPIAAGATIDSVTITPSLSPVPVAPQTTSNTCDAPMFNATTGVYSCTLTVNSPTPGTFTANASTTVTFSSAAGDPSTASVTRTTSASSGPGGSGPATKQFVDARITIGTSGTNKVGDPHTFTVLVEKNDGSGWVPAGGVDITSTESGVGSITGGSCGPTGATGASGTCTVIVNSAGPGTSTVHASGMVTVGGLQIAVATSGYGAHNVSNQKTWVDARITIGTSGTNKVGDPHTFMVFVEKNDGSGWVDAAGVAITSSSSGVGSITGGTCGPSGPTNADGECTVTVNSTVPGTANVRASGTVTVGGLKIAVATSGYGAHDVSNQKTWVDARITISENATNQVNDPHTFTVLVEKNDGTGWSDAAGVTIGSTSTGVGSITGGSCGPSGPTNADGECTVIVNSVTPGQTTVRAAGTVTVGGLAIAVATNGYGAHDVGGVKTWVDARITIGQSGTNKVGDPHTFTVFVEKNDGTGWSDAAGVTIGSTSTGVGSITGGSCGPSGPTNADGECTVIVNSATPGSATVHASGTVTVGGVPIAVSTSGYGAHDVSNAKTWVDARITIGTSGTNAVGDPHTFTVFVERNDGTGWSDAAGVDIGSTSTGVGSITGGTCGAPATGPTNTDGECTIIVNSSVAGTATVQASGTVTVGGVPIAVATNGYGAHDVSNVKTWANARITISPIATNKVGDPHTFTVLVEKHDGRDWSPAAGVVITTTTNFGSITGGTCGPTGPTNADGKCTVIVNSTVPGTATVHASGTVTVGGVPITVSTSGLGAHDIRNTKTWVDARITISRNATNQVNDPHTFTVHVEKNDGSGWSDAAGVTISSTSTGVGSITGGTCGPSGPTNADGECTVIVNSTVPGSTTVHASGTVTVGGVSIPVATNGYGAHDVGGVKAFVDARITIGTTGVNQVGDPHTFTVFVEKNDGTGWSAAAGVAITSTETGVGSITGGTCGPTGPTGADGKC
ncbi:MAG: hypothetical protein H0V68_04175, partial [Actinobacteria bacterium]|nr:hypothetical protein [Actinomycetota bacterium]